MRIYRLDRMLDDPRFEGFGLQSDPNTSLSGPSIRDALSAHADADGQHFVTPLSPDWRPPRVVGRVRPYHDFPCLGLAYPVFSERAVEALREFLEPNGELLPLVSSVGKYYLYNCLNIADILDLDRCTNMYWDDDGQHVYDYDRIEVVQTKVTELSVFRIKYLMDPCFVTNVVAQRIMDARLVGFHLLKVWPQPKEFRSGIYWKTPECQDEYTQPSEIYDRPITGNSVILRLGLEKKSASKEESARASQIADELDAMLFSKRKNAKYYGSLEANECTAGEARYFFSCPDADELVKKLKPWVKSLDWPRSKKLTKRYGEYVDESATEEDVRL